MEAFALLIAATLNAGTVLAIAALGLLVSERSGVVNLGAEGLMLVAAVSGFAAAVHSGSDWVALAAGAGAGALLAALFGLLVIWLNANQYATGLALSLFGAGFSAFAGIRYTQERLPERVQFELPGLAELPFVGPALFRQHPVVYLAIALAIGLAWWLARSRAGLVLRAVGESPESAHALGYPVRRIRLAAVVAGGALCGVAGAYLFGGVTMLQFHLQGQGVDVPSQWLSMLPYLATIVVLVAISRNANWVRANMPTSLGKPFFPGA